jgi:hypothetical protein
LDDYKFPKAWNETLSKQIQDAYKNLVIEKELLPRKHGVTRKEFA